MLTQQESNELMKVLKTIKESGIIEVPEAGYSEMIDAISECLQHKFVIDINRKGRKNIEKYTCQLRYQRETVLLRLDVSGKPHRNPDGTKFDGNHLHIYREGYGSKIAIQIPDQYTSLENLLETFIEFLRQCNVSNINDVDMQGAF